MAATPSLPRGNSMISIGISSGGGGGSNFGKLFGENAAARATGMGCPYAYFHFLFFQFSYPLQPPGANSKNPLGFSGGRNGGCRWGLVRVHPREDDIFGMH